MPSRQSSAPANTEIFLATRRRARTVRAMPRYSDFIDRLLLGDKLFNALTPREPLAYELVQRIREADDATLAGKMKVADAAHFSLVRGGLYYAVDALDECHKIFQEDHTDLGSYWHGMMHRREGDFDNARYWFRRTSRLMIADTLHEAAAHVSPLMARQSSWDAYVLTGECEQAVHGAEEKRAECVALLRVEFDGLLDYCWRKASG